MSINQARDQRSRRWMAGSCVALGSRRELSHEQPSVCPSTVPTAADSPASRGGNRNMFREWQKGRTANVPNIWECLRKWRLLWQQQQKKKGKAEERVSIGQSKYQDHLHDCGGGGGEGSTRGMEPAPNPTLNVVTSNGIVAFNLENMYKYKSKHARG